MKVYILSDMEGTAGVSIWEQVIPGCFKYEQACRLMTEEVNAAACGAFDAGADLVLVNDTHLKEHNLALDILDRRVEYLTGYGKSLWEGLDDSFDVVLQIGAHAKVGTRAANLRHTWDCRTWVDLKINGHSIGEIGLVAGGAAEKGVPCTLVTGDDKACAEAANLIPGIIQAIVKKGVSWQAARSVGPEAARELIRQRAKQACLAAEDTKLVNLGEAPICVEIIQLAAAKADYYASSLEIEQLFNEALIVQRATATTIQEAFYAALLAKPEQLENSRES